MLSSVMEEKWETVCRKKKEINVSLLYTTDSFTEQSEKKKKQQNK
jgi:hypothetical protein